MKALRLMYLWLMYILASPLALIGIIGVAMYELYAMIRHRTLEYAGECLEGVFEGFAEGHEINMLWVRYGKDVSKILNGENAE